MIKKILKKHNTQNKKNQIKNSKDFKSQLTPKVQDLVIDGHEIRQGENIRINIDMGSIFDFTEVKMPMQVVSGINKGPIIFICSTIHGDEIIGIEIVRRVLSKLEVKKLSGVVIAIPIVNVFGFNDRSRYLPDRRDLNRCFPGIKNGSLASQLAFKFMQEIVVKSNFGIDIHTGAYHRNNLPQIRTNLNSQINMQLAQAFNAPAIVNSDLRDGSLREAASQAKIPMVLYEAGEALRFDEEAVEIGVDGIFRVLAEIGMIEKFTIKKRKDIFVANSSSWIRASQSGIFIPKAKLGDLVKKGDILAEISNPFGDNKVLVKALEDGLIIGTSMLPLVNKGDAIFHLGSENYRDNQNHFESLGIDLLNYKHF